ncbi:unnamed protein product [Adineta ricciae]|uniref:Ig-like domain-containing protein n=1 Tax=Adineta ricciae TaxID=249248 RepID=A0A815VGX3_ADIRI|nr:unnamed protein product [Adineta ricciae]
MNSFLIIIVWYLPLMVQSQSGPCSCQLDSTGMTMVCVNVNKIHSYQQCVHEQLNLQSDLKLRRGGVITNLTIKNHQLRSLTSDLFQFSYGNTFYQLTDLRYLHIVHGHLKQIQNRSLTLIERALEHLDLSSNELEYVPKLSNNNEQYGNLIKLILSHNQIHRLSLSDIRPYNHLQQLDLSYNRLQYVDMSIVTYLTSLRQLFLNANMLRTLTNNITFPNNFHFKLSSNPLECDCRLRWLRNGLNRLQYPIFHDEPQCEMPKALADRKIVSLREQQFVCGPTISKPDVTVLSASNGEIATLRCDVYSDPGPEVWWTFQNKIIGKMVTAVNEPDIHTGSYTIRYSCLSISMDSSSPTCLNKTTTLTISNIGAEHNGTYNCVAAIRNQGRSDNEHLSYELRVRRSSPLTENSLLLWTIGIFLFLFVFLLMLLFFCWILRCHRANQQQAQRNKALLFNYNGSAMSNGYDYKEKHDENHHFVGNGTYDPYDMIDSRSQLGPPMYSEVRMVDSTPLRSINGGGSMSSTLLRRNDPFYDSYRSDRQLYEQMYRPSPLEPAVVDEFEDEMIFPTGYDEDYQYREDIMKPNQAVDPRRQAKVQHTNHDRSAKATSQHPHSTANAGHQKLNGTSNGFVPSNTDRTESQYTGLIESQL